MRSGESGRYSTLDPVLVGVSYDAVLFDMDGVLVTGRETASAVYRQTTACLLRSFGKNVESGAWSNALENPSSAEAFREACVEFGLSPEAAWGYREHVATSLERRRIRAGNRPPFGDTETLHKLPDRCALGICSNNRHATVGDCIDEFGWSDEIVAYRGRFPTLSDFELRKPNPTYLRWVTQRIGAASPLFVGDRLTDVRTAERVGCDAALLSRNGTPDGDDPTPTYHIQSLEELPGILERN